MREVHSEDGGIAIESELHGVLIDTLEGVGWLTPLPGVADVADPICEWGSSVLDADRAGILRRCELAGYGLLDSQNEYWGDGITPYNGPVVVGNSWVLVALG